MTIDMHAHLDPRILGVDVALSKMDAAGVSRVGLIPAMNDPIPESPTTKPLLAVLRRLMDSRARPLAEMIHRSTLREDAIKLGGLEFPLYPLPNNDRVVDIVREHPSRFFGWIFLNPSRDPNVLDTLERYRAVPGMMGVKLHPHWHDYQTDLLGPVLARCEELGLPALIHLGFGKRGAFRDICERFPKLKVISAHGGFPFYSDLWRYKNAYPNLHVDLSSPYIDERLVRRAVEAMGAERCLYGTDAPYGFHEDDGSYDYGEILGWIHRLPVSSAAREQILVGNAVRLLGDFIE